MMSVIRILYSTLMLSVVLTGCSQAKTYQYYMEHPNALIKAVRKCQNASERSRSTCQVALKAKQDFSHLVTLAEQNRQQFGQTILQTQMRIAQQESAIKRLQDSLQTAHKSDDRQPQQTLRQQLNQQQKQLTQLKQRNRQYLAVIRLQGI